MYKTLHKFAMVLANFSILVNTFLTPITVYAQDSTPTDTPPAVTETVAPTDVPQSTPEPTTAVVEPTSVPEVTVSPTVVPEPTIDNPEPTTVDPQPTTMEVEPTVVPEPTTTPEGQVEGASTETVPEVEATTNEENAHVFAVVIEDVNASSIAPEEVVYDGTGTPQLATDKADYAPTDVVLISGTGFEASKEYDLVITGTGEFRFDDKVKSDESGGLFYTYQLDGTYRPDYKVEVLDNGNLVSLITFTDAESIKSPTSEKNPKDWSHGDRAYSNNNSHATSSSEGSEQGYKDFNFTSLSGYVIDGIEVGIDAKSSDASGCSIFASLSWNDGSTYTSVKNSSQLSNSDTYYYLGGSANNWGRTWLPSDFANTNFAVKIYYDDTPPNTNCSNSGTTVSVDHVQVKVYYSTANTCGDGTKAGAEACDDSNVSNSDGCSSVCTIETGYQCTGTTPSVCTSFCGNGIVTGSEECDDDNITNGDGCSSTCSIENHYSCVGSPSVCTEGKIDWCHCTPSGVCNTLNLAPSALQNAGHMNASGNPLHAGDYLGACACTDSDQDGICDSQDNCSTVSNSNQADADGDGVGDVCDVCVGADDSLDDDSDDVPNGCDNCPSVNNSNQADSDVDGHGDACDVCAMGDDEDDADSDGVPSACDNCSSVSNSNQLDVDGDLLGDACDPQICGNQVVEVNEQCDDGNVQNRDGCSATCQIETGSLTICKYNDLNKDGLVTAGEPKLWWEMTVVDKDGADINETWYTATPADACLTLSPMDFGEYEITEKSVSGWTTSYPTTGNSQTVSMDVNNVNPVVNFLNYETPVVCGDGVVNQESEDCDGTAGVTTGQNFCSDQCKRIPIYNGGDSCPDGTVKAQNPLMSVNVSATDSDGVALALSSSGKYLFEVSGTFRPTSPAGWYADAGYTTNNNWTSLVAQYGIGGSGDDYAAHALLADLGSGVGVLNWGPYSAGHVYSRYFDLSINDPEFVIGDRYGDWFSTVYQNQAGMRDNSGSLNLNVYECQDLGSITIIKDVNTESGQDFDFTGTGPGVDSTVTLDDDSDSQYSNSWNIGGTNTGTYVFTEGEVSGWTVTNIVCTGTNGAVVDIPNGSVSITPLLGEDVTCTFTNTLNRCGDGVVNQRTEQCDGRDGVSEGNLCSVNCQLIPVYDGEHSCSDGKVPVSVGNYSLGSTDSDGVSFGLTGGQEYLFKVLGTYNYDKNNAGKYADGAYATNNNWSSTRSDIGIWGTNRGVTSVLGNLGSGVGVIEWDNDTSVDGDHIYQKAFTPSGDITSQFLISDWYSNWYANACDNQSCMNDNIGGLNLEVYECRSLGSVSGTKWNDLDGDGVKDGGEPGLSGWSIMLKKNIGDHTSGTTTTDGSGNYTISGVTPDDYYVCEYPNTSDIWYQSYPNSGSQEDGRYCHQVTVGGGQDVLGVNFGNHQTVKINAKKVVCDSEQYLPNWGNHGAVIGVNTAQRWVNQSGGHCRLEDQWSFQWGPAGAGSFGAFQTDTSFLGGSWTTFPAGETEISDISNLGGRIEVRETFQDNYGPLVGFSNSGNNSAEFYCTGDVLNYDNWEWINSPQYGTTYYCVGFNAYATGTIRIVKDVVPDDSVTRFRYNLTGPNDYSVSDNVWEGNPSGYPDLLVGDYTLTETSSELYETSISCVDQDQNENNSSNNSISVTLNSGDDITCTITNTKLGSISGQKFEDRIGNHQKDVGNGDNGLFGWTINLYNSTNPDFLSASTTTNGSGDYKFENLDAGRYIVCENIDNPAVWAQTYPTEAGLPEKNGTKCYEEDVAFGQDLINVDFGNFYLNTVSGKKFEDLNNDGSYSDGESYLEDWTMRVYKQVDTEWNLIDSPVTNSLGFYQSTGLTVGTYKVCEVMQSGWVQTYPATGSVSVNTGEEGTYCQGFTVDFSGQGTIVDVDYGNVHLGKINVCKYDDYDGDGVRDDDEPGISGVTMTLEKRSLFNVFRTLVVSDEVSEPTWTKVGEADTKDGGCYTFENLEGGDYRVMEDLNDLPDYTPSSDGDDTTDGVTEVVVTPGQTTNVTFLNKVDPVSISLQKGADESATGPSDVIYYTLKVKNESAHTAYDVEVSDYTPFGFTYVTGSTKIDGSLSDDPSISGTVMTWNLGNMAGEQEIEVKYQMTAPSTLSEGTYTNIAVASAYNRGNHVEVTPTPTEEPQLESFLIRLFSVSEVSAQTISHRVRSESTVAFAVVRYTRGISFSTGVGGQVLGASTVLGATLPASGSETYILITLLSTLVLGVWFKYLAGKKLN